ncbi:DUF4231 domain-containing protein [Amycolatopsis balhimycina DSM 5908]|uniref:DUF4231 domain-containing protein n=1 Tax=Amycolatopsis balhimycina DSM 5908 TaxID=1081091 RepID=A0A428VVC6_AMYBA|nr:DUF4231 domain-containing protein [Amycolatopsis balhimycina]RSM34739.1 DUF4231 domain-containing protein [Amycolatopsis balhimycina DSM 5908]
MDDPVPAERPEPGRGLAIADASYDWYRSHAIRSRRWYKVSEVGMLALSASIPVIAAISATSTVPLAIIGAVLVVGSGLRSVFHWQDNYLRYSTAREAIDAERRLYHIGAEPYADAATREETLVRAVTRIEQGELTTWTRVAAEKPRT